MRFQFPLYKMFLITAAYAVAFGEFSHLGVVGISIGAFIGTAVGGLTLAVKTKKDVLSALIVMTGSLIGASFASLFLSGIAGMHPYQFADLAHDSVVVSLGVIIGGLLLSWASKR